MSEFSLMFPQNDFRAPEEEQPSFFKYPQQNNRTAWLPVWTPTILVVPWVRDGFGNPIPNSEVWGVSFYVEATSVAPVAGHDNVGVFNPDYNVYRVDIPDSELPSYKIDLRDRAKFYRLDESTGESVLLEGGVDEAQNGDYIEYTLDRGVLGRIVYYIGADYYDFSTVEIPTEELPRGRYNFIWEAHYNKRIFSIDGTFKCIYICTETDNRGCGVAYLEYPKSHPGEILGDMYDKTPAIYFDNLSKATDKTIGLYRPIADALQDIFDEQSLMRGVDWVYKVPAQYIPYLAYLIGVDLPNFTGVTDEFNEKVRRAMVERGANLQRLKGSRRAIIEMFNIFGIAAEIIQCWVTADGARFLAPNERLPEEYRNNPDTGTQEISASNVCQTDPLVINFNESGFGEIDVPLMHRATDPTVILDAFVVDDLPTWTSGTAFSVGDRVLPTVGDGFAYECLSAGTSGTDEPAWPASVDEEVVDNNVTWRCIGHLRGAMEGIHHLLLTENPDAFIDPDCIRDASGYPIQCELFRRLTFDGSCNRESQNYWPGLVGYSRVAVNDVSTLYEEHYGNTPYQPDIEVGLWKHNHQYELGDYVQSRLADGAIYQCILAGTSGDTDPAWNDELNRTTLDGSVRWMTVSVNFMGLQRSTQGSIIFDRNESRIRAVFSKHYELDNKTLYVFVTYQRQQLDIPKIHQISDLRTNRFDLFVLEKFGDDADISVYEYLINFVFRSKAFHSLLRKIVILKPHQSVYNVTDWCAKGNIPGIGDQHQECLQVPPPVLPECSGSADYICDESDLLQAGKESDIIMRSRIAEGLKEEYDGWRLIKDDYRIPEEDLLQYRLNSTVDIPLPDYEDAWNYRGQDRLTYTFLLDNVTVPESDLKEHIENFTELTLLVVDSEDNEVTFESVATTDIPKQQFRTLPYPNSFVPPLDVGVYITVEFRYEYDFNRYYVIGDINIDHPNFSMDPRPKVVSLDRLPVPAYCYNGRVKDDPIISPVLVPGEVARCKPCLMLGQGFYYIMNCSDAAEPISPPAHWYETNHAGVMPTSPWLDLSLGDPEYGLHFDNDYFLRRLCQGDITRPELDIDKMDLFFPGHRFMRMGSLKHDFVHDRWKARPWDDPPIDPCECPVTNYLNPRFVPGEVDCCGEVSQLLVFDEEKVQYLGNNQEPDMRDFSGTSTDIQLTHAIYTTEDGGPYSLGGDIEYAVESDTLEYTMHEFIDVDEAIFNSARRCVDDKMRDFIDGYPARFGRYKMSAEEFWSARAQPPASHPFYCDDDTSDPNPTWPQLAIIPDIDAGEYEFAATLSSGVPTDLPEYRGYRLDCGCLAVTCETGENEVDPGHCNIPIFIDDRGQLDTHCELLTVIPSLSIADSYDVDSIIDECPSSSGATFVEDTEQCLEFIVIGEPGPEPPIPPVPPPFICDTGVIGFRAAYPIKPEDETR